MLEAMQHACFHRAGTPASAHDPHRLQLIRPYWITNPDANKPRLALAGVVALSLATTAVSVVFSFLGRDFFNALSQKDEAQFYAQLAKYLGGFAVGIPVFVFRDYFVVRPCPHHPCVSAYPYAAPPTAA